MAALPELAFVYRDTAEKERQFVAHPRLVIAPREADWTSLAYLARKPLV
jgi:hypothetical protein